MPGRSSNERPSDRNLKTMLNKQGGCCKLCTFPLNASQAEANHSTPLVQCPHTKPDQALCRTCHRVKTAKEHPKTTFKKFGLSPQHLRSYLNAIQLAQNSSELTSTHFWFPEARQELFLPMPLATLMEANIFKPTSNYTHKLIKNAFNKKFPMKTYVVEVTDFFPEGRLPNSGKKFLPLALNSEGSFIKNGSTVHLRFGDHTIAKFLFDGRRGKIAFVEWVGKKRENKLPSVKVMVPI